MRQATPRAWRCLLVGAVAVAALVGPLRGAVAQEEPPPAVALPPNPLEPAGRGVCNVAFTLAGALGLTSFVVPPDAGLDVNQVIVALRPILETCVGVFPPAPARQCFTTDLYPSTGLPLTLPDPVGILTAQAEALAALLEPLGVAFTGPLHDLFVSALLCEDLAAVPAGDEASTTPTTGTATAGPGGNGPPAGGRPGSPMTVPVLAEEVAAPGPVAGPAAAPSTSLVSAVPKPLRGVAVAAAVLFAVAGAFAFRRLLSPRRPSSLLDR